MRLNSQTITAALQKKLQPLYFFFGDETLLLEEALDALRKIASQQGYSQRERYTQETGFDWAALSDSSATLSLFSEKRIIEIRLPTGKPGDAGANYLIDYASRINGNDGGNDGDFDTILVVISAGIDKRGQNTKWFKALEQKAVAAQFSALSAQDLSHWIAARLRQHNVEFDAAFVERLATYVEGNLLAAAQEINLIGLLYANQHVSVADLEKTIADHARFDVFQFVDSVLAGNVQRSIRILETLRREQFEPVVILWALARDVRILTQLADYQAAGKSTASHYRQFGIWQSRSRLFDGALNRLDATKWRSVLQDIARIDLIAKGQLPAIRKDIWQELESLVLKMCAAPVI